jgi:predicted MPP superfamily phosphohydrolase
VTLFGVALLSIVGAGQACTPRVKRVSVPVDGLHPDLDGFRIVQISDVHIGAGIQERFVERIAARVNELEGDVVAITGDLADGLVNEYSSALAPFESVKTRYGIFYVTGNHEYYWGVNSWVDAIRAAGIRPLLNEHQTIRHGAADLVIGGVTDLSGHHFAEAHRTDPRRAFEGSPEGAFRLLLAHQPQSAKGAVEQNVDLQLSGHTHGGQYFPFNLLIRFFQPIVSGLHRVEQMWLYVSPGTGYWGPPTRLGVPGEITVLELKKAS